MVGLGETDAEVRAVIQGLRDVDCDILNYRTISPAFTETFRSQRFCYSTTVPSLARIWRVDWFFAGSV